MSDLSDKIIECVISVQTPPELPLSCHESFGRAENPSRAAMVGRFS